MAFIAIPTLAGQAAIAAAVDPDDPIPLVLSKLVVGDGNGSATTPLETQTSLVHQTAEVPIAATSRDGNKLTIDAVIDETIGGFVIREAGILDEDGVLIFVASLPETEKIADSPSTQDILTIGLIVIVSDTAAVTINVDGITYATHDYVNSAITALRTNIATPLAPYHIAVKSMALATPPASPTPGDCYVVAADATGSWAGQTGKLTQYIGSSTWVFVALPNGHLVGNEATGLLHQKIAGSWVAVLPANAAGWLQNDGSGVKTWSDPFNIKALSTRSIVGADLIPFHATAVDAKRKTTASDIATLAVMSDYLNSEMFFLGMM